MKEIFTKSERFKQEYCCSIVRIGELKPIEGSDFLAQTIVDGFSIVVRKDECKEGDIMFYCENETAINRDFLAVNNLFEMGERELNSNYNKVQSLIDEGKTDEAKRLVGFFNKHGRVKLIRLRGCPSMGFLFKLDSLINFDKSLAGIDLESLIGTDFDTINGKEFIKAYVPPVKEGTPRKSRSEKRDKRIKRFNRMVEGEFHFHYDTDPLQKNMFRVSPTDVVTISNKLHGTSFIMGNVLVKKPSVLNAAQKWLNNKVNRDVRAFNKTLKPGVNGSEWSRDMRVKLLKRKVATYSIGYGDVYSSRGVIKNQYINEGVTKGFYDVDVWGVYNKLLSGMIPKGYTIYGEIVGYVPGSQSMIQKGYDYGCAVGENKLMVYRVNYKGEDGVSKEMDVLEVEVWTKKLLKNHPELEGKVITIPILYHGTLADLYPEVSTDGHWHENVLELMKNDKNHFGMEELEPLCTNKVPREGVVLRIDGDVLKEAFKLKCLAFLSKEAKLYDSGEIDVEAEEAYS